VAGIDAHRDPLMVKHRTGYCPDVGGLVPRATVWEHLQLAARLRGMTGWEERARPLLERFDLAGVADRVTAALRGRRGAWRCAWTGPPSAVPPRCAAGWPPWR
jgi:ABC-type multidrug transport system ATPase subunit